MYLERFTSVEGHLIVSIGQGSACVDTVTFVGSPISHARSKCCLLISHDF